MKNTLLILISISLNSSVFSQESFPWYTLDDAQEYESELLESIDCEILTKKETKGKKIVEFKGKPLFHYSNSNFIKWSDKKYLIQASAHIYKVDDSQFLIIDMIINSLNAKRSYGDLERAARMKLYLSNDNFIYLENLERDRGKINRSKEYTSYRCVLALDKSNKKHLQKNFLIKIGIMWEEAYQEYEVLNIDLIKNQLNCLNH